MMKRILTLSIILLALAAASPAQVTTTITDTVYTPTGALANGTVAIRAPVAFTAADGTFVAANSFVQTNVVAGVLSVALVPNQGSNPLGSYYLANYNVSGATFQETWLVPQSGTAVKLIAVRAQVIPYLGLTAAFDQLNAPAGCLTNQVPKYLNPGWSCITSTGSGTVTSVGLAMPSWFAIGGSPITTSGTITVVPATGQTSHQVIGTCGTATSFAPCSLVAADLPAVFYQTIQSGGTGQTQRPTFNLIQGANVTLTVADNSGQNRTDITIAASGGGGGTPCNATANSLQYNNNNAFGCVTQLTYASNILTGASGLTVDFTGTTQLKTRVSAGLTTSANGDIGSDSTTGIFHAYTNGNDRLVLTSTNVGGAGQIAIGNGNGTFTMADPVVSWNNGPATTASWTSATGNNTTAVVSLTSPNMAMVTVTVAATSTMTGGTLNFELDDGSGNYNWQAICDQVSSSTSQTTFNLAPGNVAWQCQVAGFSNFRVRLNPVITGTGTATLRVTATTAPIEAQLTVGQAIAGNLNATVVFPSAQPVTLASTTVTGTVAVTQSGNWTNRIVGNAGGIMDAAGQNAASPANELLIAGQFNTSPTTVTSGNVSPLQIDSGGRLIVNCASGCGGSGGTSIADEATFTQGTTSGTPAFGLFSTAVTNLTNGQTGLARVTNDRMWMQDLEKIAGTALGATAVVNYGSTPASVAVPAVNAFVTNTVAVSGTVTANQGTANATPWNENIAQYGGTATSLGQKTMAASIPIVPASDYTPSDTVGSTTALNAANAAASVALQGQQGSSVLIASGTLAATVVPEYSTDGGTTWNRALFWNADQSASQCGITQNGVANSIVVTNPNPVCQFGIIGVPSGSSNTRVRVSSFTSGTANATVRAALGINQRQLTTLYDATGVGIGAFSNFGTSPGAVSAIGVNASVFAGTTGITATGSSLNVNVTNSSGGGTALADEATFTQGTTQFTPAGCFFNTSVTNLTSGQGGAFQCTNDRNLFVNVNKWAGSALGAMANYGTSPGAVLVPGVNAFITNTVPVTLASTTITGTVTVAGNLTNNNAAPGATNVGVLPALANTSAPSYTNGDQVLLSTDLSGNLRVSLTGTNAVTLASTTITGTVAVTESGTWTNRILGNAGGILDAAQNAAAPANELVAGAVFNNATGTTSALTAGNATQLQADSHGLLLVNLAASQATVTVTGANTPSDAFANPTTAVPTQNFLMGWNGSTWDRVGSEGNSADAEATDTLGDIEAHSHTYIFNGSTFDRLRSAGIGNNVASTGVLAAGAYVQFNTSLPTLTNGNYGALQSDSNGRALINCAVGCGGSSPTFNQPPNWAIPLAPLSLANGATAPLQLDSYGRLIVVNADDQAILNVLSSGAARGAAPILGTFNRRITSTGDALDVNIKYPEPLPLPTSSASAALTPFRNGALTGTVVVKNGQANLWSWVIYNPNASACFLDFFNTATPTLGTTVPVFTISLLSTGATNVAPGQFAWANFNAAMSVAAVTATGGATTCTTGVVVSLGVY